MLGWVGTLINKGWLDRDRYVHLLERQPPCGRGRVRKEEEGLKEAQVHLRGCRLIGGIEDLRCLCQLVVTFLISLVI